MEIPKKIKHIHLIAICGTGMGSLAGLLVEKGYTVSGSDQNTYPPMSTELESLGIRLCNGYKPENLTPRPDLIIVGNAVSKANPEVEAMLAQNIPYISMPQALSQFFIEGKKSIVIAGTHGKTTTTALMSHALKELGSDPSYWLGGILQSGQKNYHAGSGPYFAIEGDEYDTAFFDKGPKFLHYQPYYTILTSLEFDHADIYRDLDHLSSSFEKLLQTINPNGFLLACGHYPQIQKILPLSKSKFETYGLEGEVDWKAQNFNWKPEGTNFEISYHGKKEFTLHSPLPGKHNVQNALAVVAMLKTLGFKNEAIANAFLSFRGVKRRQEVRGIVNDIIVMDDFAHHPTAIAETIEAVKNQYPNHKLWAVFEPRSNTSKTDIFQEAFGKCFSKADHAILADVFMPEKVKSGNVLNVKQVVEDIQKGGVPALQISGPVENIVDHLTQHVKSPAVILAMSNGGFGAIHQKLLDALKK